jgi:hypothetical protein
MAPRKRNKNPLKQPHMKTNILFMGFLWFMGSPLSAQYQYQFMEDEFIEIGAGNYFIHLDKETDVRKTVLSVVKSHRFPTENLLFNKGKNLYFASYFVNPSDDRYMYVVHAKRAREGYDLYFLYCTNNLTHHFEFTEGKDLYSLKYDPEENKSQVMTNLIPSLVENGE